MAHYDRYYAFAHAPFLKQEFVGKWFEYSYAALAIEPQALPDSIFNLPDLPLARYPGL